MAITTKEGTAIGQNVVSDPNANVTVGDPNAVRHISPEAAILFNQAIVARPLMVPEVCSIRIKNHEYRYRWANRDALGGRIYMQRRAQGFVNATPDDVEVLSGDAQSKDGEIRAGDVVLMKMAAHLYDGAIKANMIKARTLANARGLYSEGGSSDVNSDATPTRRTISAEPGATSGRAVPFIPGNTDAIIADSIKSGRAEVTRAVVDEIRAKGKEK